MDAEKQLASMLAEEIMAAIDQEIKNEKSGIKRPDLYTYIDKSKPYGQQRVWVRANVKDGTPHDVQCEEKDCISHFGDWEPWDRITKT
jgi:hypothetical protein